MTPSKEAIETAKELFDRHYMQWPVIYTQALEAAYAIDFVALQQENERLKADVETYRNAWNRSDTQLVTLRATLADPPPDVQEAVIRKLGLVSKALLRELAGACKQFVHDFETDFCIEGVVVDDPGWTLTEKHYRAIDAALARAEEVLK